MTDEDKRVSAGVDVPLGVEVYDRLGRCVAACARECPECGYRNEPEPVGRQVMRPQQSCRGCGTALAKLDNVGAPVWAGKRKG